MLSLLKQDLNETFVMLAKQIWFVAEGGVSLLSEQFSDCKAQRG